MKTIINHILNKNSNSPILLDVFYEETATKKPIVVFCHGFKGYKDWGAFNLMADFFARKGYVFVKFNFSHNGGTIDQPIDFPDLQKFAQNTFSIEQQDLEAVINSIEQDLLVPNKEKDTNQIFLMGFSRGGATAIIKSTQDKRIKKIATLASVIDMKRLFSDEKGLKYWKEKGVYYVPNQRTKQEMPLNYTFYLDFIANQETLDIEKNAHKINIPQLIIHGNQDETVSVTDAHLMKKLNPNAELFLLEINHTFGMEQPWDKDFMPAFLSESLDKIDFFFKKLILKKKL